MLVLDIFGHYKKNVPQPPRIPVANCRVFFLGNPQAWNVYIILVAFTSCQEWWLTSQHIRSPEKVTWRLLEKNHPFFSRRYIFIHGWFLFSIAMLVFREWKLWCFSFWSHPGRFNMEPTNHPFRNENYLPFASMRTCSSRLSPGVWSFLPSKTGLPVKENHWRRQDKSNNCSNLRLYDTGKRSAWEEWICGLALGFQTPNVRRYDWTPKTYHPNTKTSGDMTGRLGLAFKNLWFNTLWVFTAESWSYPPWS